MKKIRKKFHRTNNAYDNNLCNTLLRDSHALYQSHHQGGENHGTQLPFQVHLSPRYSDLFDVRLEVLATVPEHNGLSYAIHYSVTKTLHFAPLTYTIVHNVFLLVGSQDHSEHLLETSSYPPLFLII
ncbi:hypothetical protein D3C76_1450510 [compost metagenome]